jgi:anthranilate phosphoribosyltransferase
MPTIMNVLGPVTNPAGARRQVVGVSDAALLELIAGALAELGHDRALVVHGAPGMDELSPLGTTEVLEVADGGWTRRTFDPAAELGWSAFAADGLQGGDREENAGKIEAVLRGGVGGAARAAVLLNAGAALYCAGLTPSLVDGVAAAEAALDAGAGWAKLEELRAATLE